MDFRYLEDMLIELGVHYEEVVEVDRDEVNISGTLRGAVIEALIDRIGENPYYKDRVVRLGPTHIEVLERVYIDGSWMFVLTKFEEGQGFTYFTQSILSVAYYNEDGDYFNLPSPSIKRDLEEADREV